MAGAYYLCHFQDKSTMNICNLCLQVSQPMAGDLGVVAQSYLTSTLHLILPGNFKKVRIIAAIFHLS